MYGTILVATDDSPAADVAIARALDLAELCDASLHALYVVHTRLGRTAATKEPYERAGGEAVSNVEHRAAERGINCKTGVREGTPPEAILEYADGNGVDLVILGGKNKSGAERFLIGDTAEKVVRHASMSVLVARE